MFIVTNRITVAPENAAAFEETFSASMRDHLGGVPGLQRATLLRPEADGLPYVSTMEFDSKDAFMGWMRSDSFRNSHANADANRLASQSAIEQHTLIEVVPA
ncbi:antibiotic biosynthesis monooxygenase family protein [Microbacterium sp. GXF7504]